MNQFLLGAFLTVALVTGILISALYVINKKSKTVNNLQTEFSKLTSEKELAEKNLFEATKICDELKNKLQESENIFNQEKSNLENRRFFENENF